MKELQEDLGEIATPNKLQRLDYLQAIALDLVRNPSVFILKSHLRLLVVRLMELTHTRPSLDIVLREQLT